MAEAATLPCEALDEVLRIAPSGNLLHNMSWKTSFNLLPFELLVTG